MTASPLIGTSHARKLENETRDLPATMADALPFFLELLEERHAAMLAGQVDEAMFCREEARRLAVKLNGGKAGILADNDSPARGLARETKVAPDAVPLRRQKGSFIVTAAGVRVRIQMDGGSTFAPPAAFGSASPPMPWPTAGDF